MARAHPDVPWCRYADDGLVHCRTEQEAEAVKATLQARLKECSLELHPIKIRCVYCKDGRRREEYPNVKSDFPRIPIPTAGRSGTGNADDCIAALRRRLVPLH